MKKVKDATQGRSGVGDLPTNRSHHDRKPAPHCCFLSSGAGTRARLPRADNRTARALENPRPSKVLKLVQEGHLIHGRAQRRIPLASSGIKFFRQES